MIIFIGIQLTAGPAGPTDPGKPGPPGSPWKTKLKNKVYGISDFESIVWATVSQILKVFCKLRYLRLWKYFVS